MHEAPTQFVAVDWSGAKDPRRQCQAIWLARCTVAEGLVELRNGLLREEIVERLIALAQEDASLFVGLDFAFSFPSWFLEENQAEDAPAFWQIVAEKGEQWLSQRTEPFFTRNPALPKARRFRQTDDRVDHGHRPESLFKLVGPAQIGPGSLRGIPFLRRLSAEGFSVYPFMEPSLPMVVEIYPRCFYPEKLTKTEPGARERLLREHYPELEPEALRKMVDCVDAFDAGIAALEMRKRRDSIPRLRQAAGITALEGCIWDGCGG